MEQIQSHEIKDIYRVKEGLLVEIHKYESLGYHDFSKKKEKRVRGCKGLTILTEEFTDSYAKKTYPAGTYYYQSVPVKPIDDVKLFKAEIKSSGGSIMGNFDETEVILESIKDILNSY
ncbi:hypothetical protein [Sporosarcina sp. FSL W7-1283]|uniref:hypothetical protein n=1 Tax=Sporosarcina sp. FSL W7-1283 TaxID=2921560 RepID=UPI0030F87E30